VNQTIFMMRDSGPRWWSAWPLAILLASGGRAALWGQTGTTGAGVGPAACSRGDEALAARQWQAAHGFYLQCLRTVKPNFGVLSNMGTAESHLGMKEDAIGSYEKALALAPGNPKIEYNLALTYVEAGNYSAAVDHLLQLRKTASDLRYEELLAFCYYHLGHYPLAARAAEKVQAAEPDDAANALILGSAYTRMGEYDKALPLVTFALKNAGSADGHLIMGETLLGLRLYHQAMDELAQAAQIQPDLPGLHSAMGIGKVGLADSRGAMTEFALALEQDPLDYQANYYMGRLKRLDGDIPNAMKYLKTANRLHPGSAEVLFELAAIAVSQHHYAEAKPLLAKVIAQEPNHREAHFLLAECDQKTGKVEAAEKERAIFEKLRAEQDHTNGVPAAPNETSSGKTAAAAHP
jgi:tetratricopeptide (TPR) repeat protein